MSNLYDVHIEQTGKVSDKWYLYLLEYERLLAPYRSLPINLLEIGVQNGGSLEVWHRYFEEPKQIVGCDIDSKCAELTFDYDNINTVIGDAASLETKSRIEEFSKSFDVIIDDGSHKSSDIIRSFILYFPNLNINGLYIVEDLHCSYWPEFEGGLYNLKSAVSFFKRLADIVNYEHWSRGSYKIGEHLKEFEDEYGISVDESLMRDVHSIEFLDSMVIIKKLNSNDNNLGERVIVGEQAHVVPDISALKKDSLSDKNNVSEDLSKSFQSVLLEKDRNIKELKCEIKKLKEELLKSGIKIDEKPSF